MTLSQPAHEGADREAILTFNRLRFAHISVHERGLNTLAQTHDIHGYFSRDVRGVHLFKLNGELEGYLVANAHQGHFAVSAYKTPQGQTRYMHSTCSTTEKWLALEGVGMLDQQDLIKGVALERRAPVAAPTQAQVPGGAPQGPRSAVSQPRMG